MAQTHTDTNVNQLVINKMTKQEYDNLQQVSDTELYLVEEQVDSVVTQGSTNPVQSNAVYQALQNHHDVIMVYFAHNKAYTVSLTDAYYDTTDEELVAQDPATWTGQTPQLPIITVGYYYDLLTGKIYYIENEGDLPVEVTNVEIQGDTNKLYIDLNTSKAYRWNGSTFVTLVDTTYTLSSNKANIVLAPSNGTADSVNISDVIDGLGWYEGEPSDSNCLIVRMGFYKWCQLTLSNFWTWIKSKLGINTSSTDRTYLNKNGTWDDPNIIAYDKIVSGNSLIAHIKNTLGSVIGVGFCYADGTIVSGCPNTTNTWYIMFSRSGSIGNAIQLMAWRYGSTFDTVRGYAWYNTNDEPLWQPLATTQVATTSSDGLMSAEDKAKLDNIDSQFIVYHQFNPLNATTIEEAIKKTVDNFFNANITTNILCCGTMFWQGIYRFEGYMYPYSIGICRFDFIPILNNGVGYVGRYNAGWHFNS